MNQDTLIAIEASGLYTNLMAGDLSVTVQLHLCGCFIDYAYRRGAEGPELFESIRAEALRKYPGTDEQKRIVLQAINILLTQYRFPKDYKRTIAEKAKAGLGGGEAQSETRDSPDPNERDDEGFTPLFNAANHNDVAEARRLLATGALVNDTCIFNKTPLYEAVRLNRIELIRLLLENDADANIPDSNGWTPLDSACEEHDGQANIEIVKLLLAHGAKPERMRSKGATLPQSIIPRAPERITTSGAPAQSSTTISKPPRDQWWRFWK